jgi:hypothetical protein
MIRRFLPRLACGLLIAGLWLLTPATSHAQFMAEDNRAPLPRWFYYPYYYFPHSYWPSMSPRWPEPPGQPYMRPPAYMAYPPFLESHWRYECFEPQLYHRGNHFWLDQF